MYHRAYTSESFDVAPGHPLGYTNYHMDCEAIPSAITSNMLFCGVHMRETNTPTRNQTLTRPKGTATKVLTEGELALDLDVFGKNYHREEPLEALGNPTPQHRKSADQWRVRASCRLGCILSC